MVLTAGACVLAFTASQHASTNTMSTSAAGSAQSVPQSATAPSPPATKPNEPSLAGDAASLLAAVVFVGYLHAGRTLRQFMPVFVYACPVTSFAAAILTLSGVLFEGSSLLGIGARTQLGMLSVCWTAQASAHWAAPRAATCHTRHAAMNHMLPHLDTLSITTSSQHINTSTHQHLHASCVLVPVQGVPVHVAGWPVAVMHPGWCTWHWGLAWWGTRASMHYSSTSHPWCVCVPCMCAVCACICRCVCVRICMAME